MNGRMAWIGLVGFGALAAACGSDAITFGNSGGAGGSGASTADGGSTSTSTSDGGSTSNGGNGGSGGNPGGGPPVDCTTDVECEVDTECIEGFCDMAAGMCDSDFSPAGTPCGGGACDGMGNCEVGLANGEPCGGNAECASGFCADGVCCDGACDQTCESCVVAGDEGSCQPLVGVDPDNECGDGVCDGDGGCASGAPTGGNGFGDTSSQFAYGVASDSASSAIIVGRYFGTIDFGGGVIPSNGNQSDIFISKFDAMGNLAWANTYGDTSADYALHVDTDAMDNIVMGGVFFQDLDFGLGNNNNPGNQDVYVLGLNAAGQPQWDYHLIGTDFQTVTDICTGPGGVSAMVGYGQGTVDFGMGSLSLDGIDPILVVFDALGNVIHNAIYPSPSDQRFYACDFDSQGNVLVGGRFYDTANIAGATLISAGDRDAFVVKLAANGFTSMWGISAGDSADQFVRGLAVDNNDAVIVAGYSNGTIDLGGGPLLNTAGYDHYIAKLDSAGNHVWSQIDTGTDDQFIRDLQITANNQIVATGFSEGEGDFGGGTLTYNGQDDVFVYKLTADGQHLWSAQYGGNQDQQGQAIAAAPNGDILLAGYTEQLFAMGTLIIGGGGSWDAWYARLAP